MFLKILIRKNKQLFTVALSYETASVTVKKWSIFRSTSRP